MPQGKNMDPLIAKPAREVVALLKAGQITPGELIDAAEARIEAVDGTLNALPTLCMDRARQAARNLEPPSNHSPGWLAGLPIAIKDLNNVAGVRTTFGSPIFADNISDASDIPVETLERNGALVIAKSNTPEFGAGANTFNDVFGATRNPWDTSLSCGGSSGGAAVAVATGQVWLATGSDLGGSLRTPASFCSVVGLRPSPGRVARSAANPFDSLGVIGPMARDVRDVALMLDAMAGRQAGDVLSLKDAPSPFLAAAEAPKLPKKVAFTPDLGCLPVDPEIADICRRAAERLAAEGAQVGEVSPDFTGAGETFQTLRAAAFAGRHADLMAAHPGKFKAEIVWNTEKGLALNASEIAKAEAARGALIANVAEFLGDYDLLLCPAAPVAPFDVNIRYVEEIGGTRMDNYIEWIAITYCITLTACPALSLPSGFTGNGLPVGMQLIAANGEEARLLANASAMEELLGVSDGAPMEPKITHIPA